MMSGQAIEGITPPSGAAGGAPSVRLPDRAPFLLRIPEGVMRLVAAVVGIAGGIALSAELSRAMPPGSVLAAMFNPDRLQSIVPTAINAMFLWGLLICLFRGLRLMAAYRVSRRRMVSDAAAGLVDQDSIVALQSALANREALCRRSPLLRRLLYVLQQWSINPGLQNVDVLLQQQIAHDAQTVHAGYSLVRIFVWALPVLGLIGTVLGIADAVGGFSKFLAGNVEEVAKIKTSLVEVTGGLSFAFLITLHGLITSLITMLLAATVQSREEKLYALAQEDTVEIFLPRLQQVTPAATGRPEGHLIQLWQKELETVSSATVAAVRKAAEVLIKDLSQRSEDGRKAVAAEAEAARREMHGHLDAAAKTLGDAAQRIPQALAERRQAERAEIDGWIHRLSQGLEASIAGQIDRLGRSAEGLAAASHDLRQGLAEVGATLERLQAAREADAALLREQQSNAGASVAAQLAAVERIASDVTAMTNETLQTLRLGTDAVQASLHQLREADLPGALGGLADQLTRVSSQLHGTEQAVAGLARLSERVLAAQTQLQEAVRQLDGLGFVSAFADLRGSLQQLRPLLEGFQRPFVWQPVPVDRPLITPPQPNA